MVTFDHSFHVKKGNGLVRDVFRPKNMERLIGSQGIGHVRYPTMGGGGRDDAQPFVTPYPYGLAIAHNGNVTNYHSLVRELREKKTLLSSGCDVEAILNVLAIEFARRGVPDMAPEVIFGSIQEAFSRVKGSYSCVLLIADYGLVAFRDPFGIKPAVFGRRANPDGTYDYAAASENVALDIMGFTDAEDILPGEAIIFRPGEEPIRRRLVEQKHYPCIFEHVYFARPDSVLDGISVYKTRRRFGKKLAQRIKELDLEIDVVIPVPDSACTAAGTLARELGIEYREGFVKNRYIGRTFIMPNQQHRTDGIRRKLNAIPLEFEDKNVLLVDDSIVRGNTSRKIIELARQAGAKKVFFASCSPPVQHPCVYGIDMATRKELIARDRTTEEIAESLGADFLIYQNLDDLIECAREGNPKQQSFCHACFSGNYPTEDISEEMFEALETARLCARD